MEKDVTDELIKSLVAGIKTAENKRKQVLNVRYWFFIQF